MPPASGSSLGPYTILDKLGAGGMGEVFRARDTRLERDVALKVLPEDVAADPSADGRTILVQQPAGQWQISGDGASASRIEMFPGWTAGPH